MMLLKSLSMTPSIEIWNEIETISEPSSAPSD